ncbi:MAG TPA: type I phosphomannose isomerase catalytic subunit [Candidatus Baltobacteraceae bacterium]|jgi:mannose-6-phosphate isomerase|nr:type I phosphomannose isomerase catalytic subunit [Candidatus Baltobacteraceae bacterium]
MNETIYPYVIDPKETPAIWGGDALVKQFGKSADPNAKIGESWECWDTNNVTNGALAGTTIADLRQRLGSELMGSIDPARPFPVLTKIIDARDWLSVQVHPDDAYAQRVEHQPNGKTECWYVFSADKGAELVLGWNRDTSRAEYERRVADGTLGDILRRVPVKAGDVFYLPAGTLHAIGSGIVVFETQQASDLTYRIFDWNRTGADGKPRELHVAKAADVLDYHRGTRGAVEPLDYHFEGLDRSALIADPRFVVERVTAASEPSSMSTHDRPLIVMSLDHPLIVACNGVTATLERYQTALVPAAAQWCTVAAPAASSSFMLVTQPQTPETLPVQLLAAGVDQARIDRFMEQF